MEKNAIILINILKLNETLLAINKQTDKQVKLKSIVIHFTEKL